MPITTAENELAERRYVSVVIRLVLDRRGSLVYGEAMEVETEVSRRFTAWRQLTASVRACLAGAADGEAGRPSAQP